MTIGIKICGLRPTDDLSFVASSHITHVGIVFVEASKRFVSPDAARVISTAAHHTDTKVVGVFANQPTEHVRLVASSVQLDVVQLHGDESVDDCLQLHNSGLTVWKAIQVPRENVDPSVILQSIDAYRSVTDGILLDAKPHVRAQVTGGHGERFDWNVLAALSASLEDTNWWVAGGITPPNIGELLHHCRPRGIDVSSGVEEDSKKSPLLIAELIEAVKLS